MVQEQEPGRERDLGVREAGWWLVAVAVIPLALLACDGSPPATGASGTPSAPLSSQSTGSTSSASAAAPMPGVPQKVVWPAALPTSVTRVLGALPKDVGGRVAASPVPVLLPPDEGLLKVGDLVVGDSFYAFSARSAAGVPVTIHATNLTHPYPHLPPASPDTPMRGTKGFLIEGEEARGATWTENGVAYLVEMGCAGGGAAGTTTKDVSPPCASETQLLKLVEQLVYVGGKGP